MSRVERGQELRRRGLVVRVLGLKSGFKSSSLPFDGLVLGVPPPLLFVDSTIPPLTSWDFYQVSVQFSEYVW